MYAACHPQLSQTCQDQTAPASMLTTKAWPVQLAAGPYLCQLLSMLLALQIAIWDWEKVHERSVYKPHGALTNNIRFLPGRSGHAAVSCGTDGKLKVSLFCERVRMPVHAALVQRQLPA